MRIITVDDMDYQIDAVVGQLKEAFPYAKVRTFEAPVQVIEELNELKELEEPEELKELRESEELKAWDSPEPWEDLKAWRSVEPQKSEGQRKPYLRTHGEYDVFIDGKPIIIRRTKSKIILATLIRRQGAWVTNREISELLWKNYRTGTACSKYVTTLITDLIADLKNAGLEDLVERRRGMIRLRTEAADYE
ncbi:MAG: hypothetical protein LUI07_04615 [Lachnospiraceae bacterium]|nr:hypothetical protein [Lachnospiraceae bacterium]